ncbi:type I polyketide synthase [Micromonospora nigra]|uniref:type I polyketide synthase n=1 Tax=Micromonospora nigra TaxID=145857 RepID=UPI001C312214|nr:type I polyketide synthase [Micromonospora nigra]
MLGSSEGPGPAGGVEPVLIATREDVALRLFAFPHAGGGGGSFEDWPAGLADDVEIVSYSLPGRGRQRKTPPYSNWSALVADLVRLIDRYDDGAPFVFFGHSFGALVAFEVCRTLIEENRRPPAALFLSAHRAPHIAPSQTGHLLPDEQFVGLVEEWGLVPAELLRDEEVLSLVLPPLRADLALDESHRCSTGDRAGRRLPVPCVVYGGDGDRTVRPEQLWAWREHLGEETDFRVELLDGGHFYTIGSRDDLLRRLDAELDRVRATVAPSVVIAGDPYPEPAHSLWTRFQAQVAATPDALALVDPPRRWSYRELADSTVALAADLAAHGVTRGDVVGVLLPRSAEYCVTLLACFGLGTPACLLEKNWPESLLGRFLDNAEVRLVVTRQEFVERLPPAYRVPGRVLVLDDHPPAPAGGGPTSPVVFPEVEPDDIALISMTSGTSGTPKAVRNTHRGCLYCFDARYRLYPYGESSRDGLNVFFGWECLRPLLRGRAAVVVPDDHIVDPVRLVETIAELGITRIVVTPSLLESVLDHPVIASSLAHRLAHMEIVFLMGEVVPNRVVEKAAALFPADLRLVNAYSTWESLDVSFADLLPPPAAGTGPTRLVAPVGRILDGSAAVLLDDRGEPVPYGGVGELYFSGPGVADGYLNDPAKTAERFVPCPPALAGSPFADQTFYRTGDRARFLPGGGIEILGRSGDVVKVRGFKVSLRAVEAVLSDQEGVSRAIVRPVLDDRTGQPTALLAYLLGDGGRPSETVLARSRLRARRELPEYARPRHVIGLDALPISRNDARKLDLSALPPPPEQPDGTAAPTLTTMEQRLAAAWREVLGARAVEPDDNFFDVGGDSLSAARLSGLLAERFGITLPVIDVFQFSTLRAMAEHCSTGRAGGEPHRAAPRRVRPSDRTRLAIVGMAGRFPGADTVEEFWENLKNGVDSLTTFPADRLRAKGVPEAALAHPKWVSAGQLVADADMFDAQFWGIGRREALLMDPQHRVFIETAWSALEQAGYARRNNPYRSRTGVFAACGIDGYLIHHLRGGGLTDPLDPAGLFLTEIGNEKDYIATRVAYLMDLGGPAVTVTSACSSALVAVAQAAQSIVSGQCDMAIAGAAAINFPNLGYRYEEGLVGSVDGRVRPFDAGASGTLFGDSIGAVVLKRLDDAIADGDPVWAVLTGFGISNDGQMKAGYTAPSARAQAQAISDAIAMAGIDSEQISYVECHATATHVGDAIEIAGLHDAFRRHRGSGPSPDASCAIGSVKGNIGHANCAAGITGLIKTVLCLHHRALVPTVNYQTLNPKLVDLVDTEGSPFTVQATHRDWLVADPSTQLPRRAGVSSFGIGGTNAHVILEEAPEVTRADVGRRGTRSVHLVTVSAAGEGAFQRNAGAVARFLAALPAEEVGSACRALHLSRQAHALRASTVVTGDPVTRRDDLRRLGARPPRAVVRRGHAATVAFCFSGQGSQTAGMARGLYQGRADGGRFRRHFEAACARLAPHLDSDPAAQILTADETSLRRPTVTQCGLFAVEYALARALMEIGVTPVAVAGHSIGEYAAAAVAGVLSLDEAAALVAVRARATEELLRGPDPGGMVSVVGDEERLADWLADRDGLWLAVENAPGRVVLSGTTAGLSAARTELPDLGFTCRPVPVSHPFHSPLMLPVAHRLDAVATDLAARTPTVPLASNLTGSWLDPHYQPGSYWGRHVHSPVRWRQCVDTLLRWEPEIVLEIGPDSVLTALTTKCTAHRISGGPLALATMPEARNPAGDDEVALLRTIGELWCHGVEVDFAAFHEGEPATPRPAATHHLPPTYSFERTSYWVRPEASAYVDGDGAADRTDSAQQAVEPQQRPLVRFVEKPDATVRLYCLPFAGGGTTAFRGWAHSAPPWLDVVAVNPPGRTSPDGRVTPATADDASVLADLAAAVRADAGTAAVAFCGLSFGASLLLDLLIGPLADWAGGGRIKAVCVAGRAAVLPGSAAPELALDSYLMAPDELRQDERWRRETLPLLDADLAFDARAEERVVRWQEQRGTEVLDSPVQVHCGATDASAPPGSAGRWAALTTSPIVDTVVHPGAHDFLVRQREGVLDRIVAFLERLDPRVTSRAAGRSRLTYELRWVPAGSVAGHPGGEAVPWLDVDAVQPAACLRFLREKLTGPEATAALLCRLGPDRTPSQHCELLFDLLRSVAAAEVRGRLIVVLPARDDAGLVAGMTRSLAHEEPGLRLHRVHLAELPPAYDDDLSDRVDQLLRGVVAYPWEVDLLCRGGMLLAQRLLPVALPDLPPGILGGGAGSYLVTGGTGGIGRVVTDWLIHDQGVAPARLVVAGRRDPGDLRRGVRFLELDLAYPPNVERLAADTGALAGIIHLAGALDDGMLRNLDASRFPAVLAPKLALAHLAEWGRLAGAPWIVAFSSTSSLFGAAGQANYAAANGWVDARAMWPAGGGGPDVVSINWGTWGDAGMAARSSRALATARSNGETPLGSGAALRAFGGVVAALMPGTTGGRNFAVCDVDWGRFPWTELPLVSDLPAVASAPGTPAGRGVDPLGRPDPADPLARPGGPDPAGTDGDEIRSFLSSYVHRWDTSQRLADLGLDSLDFARIRSDFARSFGRDVALAAIARPDQSLGDLHSLLSEH